MWTYHTLNLPLRSILKNSPSNNKLEKKSASYSDLQGKGRRRERNADLSHTESPTEVYTQEQS